MQQHFAVAAENGAQDGCDLGGGLAPEYRADPNKRVESQVDAGGLVEVDTAEPVGPWVDRSRPS
jgi:hypothetical protein